MTLAATNGYSGNTLISGGTLALSGPLTLQQTTLDTSGGGSLSLGSLTSVSLGGLTGSNAFNLANSFSSRIALSVGSDGANTTFSGTLSGYGSLTKVGSGELLLNGSNTYAGSTVVSAGTLEAANSQSLTTCPATPTPST